MLSNNNNLVNTSSPLAKQEELQQFERNFFPAGGAPLDNNLSSNIPSAPAPPQSSNVKSKPINLKTRNWGPKLENGFAGVNRSLYDRPNVFYWDSKPSLGERQLQQQLPLASPSSSSSSTSTTSSGWSNNIPQAPMMPQWRALQNNGLFGGRRLRTRDWGRMSRKRAQWTRFNRELYSNGLQLERNVILNELWAKYQPRGLNNGQGLNNDEGLSRGISDNNLVAAPVSSSYIESLSNVTTAPLTNITTAPLTNITSAPVTNVISAPVEVRATSVPVPMLNPPLNDGRRYEKLYAMNTKANSGKSLIKPRGTRRDHLVQPSSNMLAPGMLPLGQQTMLPGGAAPAPTKKQLRQQKKLSKCNQKNGLAAPINSGLSSVPIQTMAPIQPVYTTMAPIQPVGLSTFPMQQPLTTGLVNPALGTGLVEPVAPAMGKAKHAKLGSAPLKRPRRARKAGKGTEQPVFSNMVSATQGTPIMSTQQGTTPILPLTQQSTMGPTFVKQEIVTPVQPLAFGTPVM